MPNSNNFEAGTIVTLAAIAAQNYKFVSWGGSISGSQTPISIRINHDMEIVANFEKPRYNLSAIAVPAGSGKVSPPGGTFFDGTKVNLWATANTNYRFAFWSGSASGSQNPASIKMDSSKSVIANFERNK